MIAVIQHAGAQEKGIPASDFSRLYVGTIEPQYKMSLWYDIPYYKGTTDLYKGRISYHGVVYEDVQLRFDQLKQLVVVLSPVGRILCLPEKEHIDWFEMDGHRYVQDPEDSLRFAALLSYVPAESADKNPSGDESMNGLRLYHSEWKIYNGENTFGGRIPLKTLNTKEHYTLITPDGEKHHVKRAKDVVKLFPEQKKQIRQFVKKNHLSFSRSERERSLAKVVQSLSPIPYPVGRGEQKVSPKEDVAVKKPEVTSEASPTGGGLEGALITGIPVLDNDTVATAVGSANTKVYIVPGMKKARASIADDQELAEIVVVGGRQSAVENMMIGSEKFKPQILKNIPSAFGESDIM